MNKKNIITILLASSVSALLTVTVYKYFEPVREFTIRDSNNAKYANYQDFMLSGHFQRNFISASPTNFTAAAESITPSVVNIKALSGGDIDFWADGIPASSGSGVIISPDGMIITNNHVVDGSTDIQVTLNDHREYSAKVIGTDPQTDIALLKIDAVKLKPVMLGNSDSIRVGEWVLAVGNPFNLESTVTAGIVSAKGRSINILEDKQSIESFIQTDAAVNQGNSGGALVNTNGELVGINTAIITKKGYFEGYSFAIPVNLAMKVIKDLKDFGVVQRGYLGVDVVDLTQERAKSVGLNSISGAFINAVVEGGAAADVSLRRGDVIIAVNGTKVGSRPELLELIARYRPGNVVEIEFYRDAKKYKTRVTLKNKNLTTALLDPNNDVNLFERIGISKMRALEDKEMHQVGTKGLKVINIDKDSKIERTNMQKGFIITHINDAKVETVDQANRLLGKSSGKITLEGVYENFPDPYYYTFVK